MSASVAILHPKPSNRSLVTSLPFLPVKSTRKNEQYQQNDVEYTIVSPGFLKFTIKEIAVKAQVSESRVRKTLTELSEDGFLLSEESIDGTMFYYLTEDGYSRFRYGSETIGHWGPLRDKKKLYNVLCAVSEPITIKEICKRSGASEYLIRKTIKFLEKHGEVTCEDRNARPRKYLVKAGDIAESLLTVK